MEKILDKTLRRRRFFKKAGNFVKSVGIGVLKATPFGHVAVELENNIKSEIGGRNKIDYVRFIVWALVTLLFIMKFFNVITWEDLYKFVDVIFNVKDY